jgi:HD-like signal output (HDOD) protein/CheY-like chemotaxis protein
MSNAKLIALIVDDELAIRRLVAAELRNKGFDCDIAANGKEASRLAAEKRYDVVVTDLRMPEKHGHAFILELLERADRPLIVVYTGVIEPRLATDLVARGVDDIIFKPVHLGFLAAKVKSLIARREAKFSADSERGVSVAEVAESSLGQGESLEEPIKLACLSERLSEISQILPISNAALDVYDMTRDDKCSPPQIAAAAQRDASLSAEILKRANSSQYNSSGRQITDLDEAVLRIGQARVGELALCIGALSTLTPTMLPWIDLDLLWRRSMASGLAMESLIEEGGHQQIEEGLLLSAIMYPLGRVVLGALFPEHYKSMVKQCEQTGAALLELERRLFPTTHTEILAHVLAGWRMPANVSLPLKFATDDYASLAQLSEPTRTKVELVKVAWLLGRLSVNRWQDWDFVQLPTPLTLQRIGITNVREIIRQCRSDLSKLLDFGKRGKTTKPARNGAARMEAIPYVNVAGEGPDLVRELLPTLGIQPCECATHELRHLDEVSIINGTGGMRAELKSGPTNKKAVVLLCHDQVVEWNNRSMSPITLPCSYGRLRDELQRRLHERKPRQLAGATSGSA